MSPGLLGSDLFAHCSQPFIHKLYTMVSEPETAHIVNWSPDGNGLLLLNLEAFVKEILPIYFKHTNLSSFVRQLNTYGFSKTDSDTWRFSHPAFRKGEPDQLHRIERKNSHRTPVLPGQLKETCDDEEPSASMGTSVNEASAESLALDNPQTQEDQLALVRTQTAAMVSCAPRCIGSRGECARSRLPLSYWCIDRVQDPDRWHTP